MLVQKIANIVCLSMLFLLVNSQVTPMPQMVEGIAGRLNSRGFEFMREQITNTINSTVLEYELPVFHGTFIVDYRIENLALDTFDLGQTMLQPEAPNVVVFGVNNAALAISGSFVASVTIPFWGLYSVSADITVGASGALLSQRIAFDRREDGVLTLSAAGCNASFNDFDVQINNFKPSWVGSILTITGDISDVIKGFVATTICETLEDLINESNAGLLGRIDGSFQLPFNNNWNITMDLSLSRPPVATSNSVEFASVGRCYPTDYSELTENYPFSNPIPLSPSIGMFQVSLNEYVLNTFLASLAYRESLELSASSRVFSDVTGFIVNKEFTTLFNPAIDALPVDNSDTLDIVFRPRESLQPRIEMRSGSVSVVGSFEMLASFTTSSFAIHEANMLDIDFNITTHLSASGNQLNWTILGSDISFPGSTVPIALLIQPQASSFVLSALRSLSDSDVDSFTLPSFGGYSFNIESLELKQGAMELITDVIVA